MQQWLAFPWVRYLLWLIAGILMAFHLKIDNQWIKYISLAFAVCYLLSFFVLKQNKTVAQLSWGILACGMLVVLGYTRTASSLQVQHPAALQAAYWWVEVTQEAVLTPKSYRFKASVTAAEQNELPIAAVVYIPHAKAAFLPEPGQQLLVKAKLQRVAEPLNPYEFNNREYLAMQGVHYQLFATAVVKAHNEEHVGAVAKRTAFRSKNYLLQIIEGFIQEQQAEAVVKAMVLGDRSRLDNSLRQAYADAGVMHVLAVSGLHVGMVYLIIGLLFPYLQKKSRQRIAWLVLALLVLWSYAWLTGMAPSTMRATLMFSMIAIAKAMRRKGNIYNSIAFSAFLLLLWDPLLIKQVGFQLSYLAVIGIVYLQPRISSWYQPKSSWKRKPWELLSVTLAAQLATFPLGLYYFHQFPTYFIIGNLLAVPLAFLILYSTLLLLLFHWVPFLNLVLGWLVSFFALVLNSWVQLTEQLPSSRLVAAISSMDVVLVYAILISLLLLIRLRSYGWSVVNFSLLLLLAISGIQRANQLRRQQHLTIYQIPGYTLLHFVNGQQELLLPVGESPDQQQLSYHVEPARLQAGLEPLPKDGALPQDFIIPQSSLGATKIFIWNGLKIAVIEGGQEVVLPEAPVPVDLLLLRKNPPLSLEQLREVYPFKLLLLDASNSQHYRLKTKSKANSLHLRYHITSEQGAYHHQL